MTFGNTARVKIIARSNLFVPTVDVNGDEEDGINFAASFTEGVDTSVSIVSTRTFITDDDIDSRLVSITVTLTDTLVSEEYLSFLIDPPTGISVTQSADELEIVVTALTDDVTYTDFETVLLNIRYTNMANEPLAGDRFISFVVFDGIYTNNATTTVTVISVNDVPLVDLNGDDAGLSTTVQFTEGQSAVQVAPLGVVTDPDSDISTFSVKLHQVFDVGSEVIAIDSGLIPSGVSCDPSSCAGTELTLTGPASPSQYQVLLRSLTYVNMKQPVDFPNLRDRTIFVSVSDGVAVSDDSVHILVDFLSVDPRVIIQLDVPNQNYFTNFTEGQPDSIPGVGVVRIVDATVEELDSITVTLRDNLPGGMREAGEMIGVTSTGGLDISIEINTVLKTIVFGHVASVDEYVKAVERVIYFNGEDEPYPIERYIDFEVQPFGGAPPDFAFTQINIYNIPDHIPVCTSATEVLPEDEAVGTTIHVVQGSDGDVGMDGEFFFSMLAGNTSLFQVESDGSVVLMGELDFETQKTHFVVVEICDLGVPQSCSNCTVQFNLTDVNDNPPMFDQDLYTVIVPENTASDRFVTFNIEDADSGVNAELEGIFIISYTPSDGCLGLFSTVLNPPSLSVSPPGLDFETTDKCTLIVEAKDKGIPQLSSTARVIVNIENDDDFPPMFDPVSYFFEVEENNTFPLGIGNVNATDLDSVNVSYSLSGSDADGFQVNEKSGAVSILFSASIDVKEWYNFTAVVEDYPGGNTDTAPVSVQVTPINNDPPVLDLNISDPNSFDVSEVVVFTEESDTRVLIETEPGITDPDKVELTIERIRVRVANSDNPNAEFLSVDLSGYPTGAGELIIEPTSPENIDEVNMILQSILYRNTEDEISPCNASLYPCPFGDQSRTILFSVFDGNRLDQYSEERAAYVVFELVNDPPVIDLDTLSPGNGFVVQFIEGSGPVEISDAPNVAISDEDNALLQSLTCSLATSYDGPLEFLLLNGTLPLGLSESFANDSHIVTISGSASPADYETALGLVAYNSLTNNPDTRARSVECFVSDGELDSNVGASIIIYELINEPPMLRLSVDSVNSSVTFTEDAGPVFLATNASIEDPDDTDAMLLTVTLLGATGTQEELALSGAATIPSQVTVHTFDMDSGILRIDGTASFEVYMEIINAVTYNNGADEIADVTPRMATFEILDSKGAHNSLSAYAFINIETVDDNAPQYDPLDTYTFSVSENETVGVVIGSIEVKDDDEPSVNNAANFSIVNATPSIGLSHFRLERVSPLQVSVVVNGPLNYETVPRYSLIVLAESGLFSGLNGGALANVTVQVVNVPDEQPVFVSPLPHVISVEENHAFISKLAPPIEAFDPDGFGIEYSLEPITGLVPDILDIDPVTGEIVVNNIIDRESPFGTEYELTVTARNDYNSTSGLIIIIVVGVNEFPPEFSEVDYETSVDENTPPTNAPLLTVAATDPDEVPDSMFSSGFMSAVTYSILPGNDSDLFSIDSLTGDVYLLSAVDYETVTQLVITVVANDSDASPTPMTSEVTLTVNIIDVNDELPVFDAVPDVIPVSEIASNNFVFYTLKANDPDTSNLLKYTFASGVSDVFTLNSANGELSVKDRNLLDADLLPRRYDFTVVVTDEGTDAGYVAASSSSINITIALEDVNDQVPHFTVGVYKAVVTENQDVGSSVTTVTANDADYGLTISGVSNGFNKVEYILYSNSDGRFQINNESGVITNAKVLDREVDSEHVLTVIARDSPISGTANSAIVSVRVTVIDENEHEPIADPEVYYSQVYENTPVGERISTSVDVMWSTVGAYACYDYM